MPARAVDRGGDAPPLWSQVQRDLRQRAAGGEFDAAFPAEAALVSEYGVSRNTVREALRALRAEGLVSAERGRSPRLIREREIEQPLGALYSLFSSVESLGLRQTSVVRRLERRADGVVAARLGLEESSPLVYLERLRLAGNEPLALDEVWLPASLASPLLEADFGHTSLYGQLAARCGVRLTGGREQIRTAVPGRGQRELLGCPPETAVFVIERAGESDGRAVEWRRTVVRGDRFCLQADFSAGEYRLEVASVGHGGAGDGALPPMSRPFSAV